MNRKLQGRMSKDWLTKAEALANGKLFSTNGYYKEVAESGRRFLSIGKCASIGMPVKKVKNQAYLSIMMKMCKQISVHHFMTELNFFNDIKSSI